MRRRGLPLNSFQGFIDPDLTSGIRLAGTDIWLDPRKKRPLAFISHAHRDHLGSSHETVITSLKTAALTASTLRAHTVRAVNWHEKVELGGAKVELFPAGHILGSAQIMIEKDGLRIVYTGDIKVTASFTAERIEIRKCDVLIIECTYGHPKFLFPDRHEVAHDLIKFVKDCMARRITPVIVAYRVGKAQEVVKILGDAGIRTRLEHSIYEVTRLYTELGVSLLNYRRYPPFTPHREAIVVPPHRLSLVKPIVRKRIALVTGWALDKEKISRFEHDVAIPLSDHADFAELLSYVMIARPKKVYTVHGDEEFSKQLRREGFDAIHLDTPFVQPTLWGYI